MFLVPHARAALPLCHAPCRGSSCVGCGSGTCSELLLQDQEHRSHPAGAGEAAEEVAMGFTFVEAGSRRVEGKSPGERSLWFLLQLLHSFD